MVHRNGRMLLTLSRKYRRKGKGGEGKEGKGERKGEGKRRERKGRKGEKREGGAKDLRTWGLAKSSQVSAGLLFITIAALGREGSKGIAPLHMLLGEL